MKQTTMTALAAAMLLCSLADAAPRPEDAPAPRAQRLPVKPGGPIAVEYRLAAPPVVGTPLEIAITAHVEAGVRNIAIETNPTAPRAVLVTQPEAVARGAEVYSWSIMVVPLAADAGYLAIVVSGEIDGLTQSRSVTVPLSAATAREGVAASAPAADGDAVIALPVQESP